MKHANIIRSTIFAAAALVAMTAVADPEVTDVVAKQRYPWNGLVDITFNVTGINRTIKFAVSAVMPGSVNVNNVSNFWVMQNGLKLSSRKVRANGNYQLLWDASADLGQVNYDNMVIRVTCVDVHGEVQLWEDGPYWAEMNIGAEEPEEYGYYFWWGDTVGYKRKNDKWVSSNGASSNFSFDSNTTLTYNKSIDTLKRQGWITEDSILTPEHDAAHVQWGGKWRMPTKKERSDLNSNCTWTWTTKNGVNGYEVRGKGDYAAASIFLPAAGYGRGTSLNYAGSVGGYWSPVPVSDDNLAYVLRFSSSDYGNNLSFRHDGQSIRPVQGFADIAAMVGRSGDSAPFRLDTMEGVRVAREVETIAYSTTWEKGTMVRVAVDGVTLKEASEPASGDVVWNAVNADAGYHTLTHTTYKNDVADKVETVTFQVEGAIYTVMFAANGGSLGTASTTRAVMEGTAIGTLPAPTRTGQTFAGWWTSASGGARISASTIVTGNVTCYAHWTVNQYTVTFDANGGTGGWSRQQDYGTAIVAPTVTREWFTFAGWSPAVPSTVPANDVTYTAQWQRWGDSISAESLGGKTMKELYSDDYVHMTTMTFEEGITEIPKNFFDGCNDMTSVTWPSTLREFGLDAVPPKIRASLAYDADGFMIYNNWILDYQNRNAEAVTIPEGIVGIGRGAFAAMYDLETVTMPESLTYIASGAFEDCSWIQNLQFMSGLRYVGSAAFRGCSSLLRATFADGVEYIGTNAFEDCWQMQSVRLPFTVTNIGANAFSDCSAIRGVTVPTKVKTMQQLFPASYSKIETAEVAEGETAVMADMFAGCTALRGGATQTDMSMIPNTVTNIGARAFQNCSSLTAFALPDSVVEIGDSVFQGCTALWNVTLSRSLSVLPDYAFYGCSMLETMIVPEGVTYLGNRFFCGRTNPIQGQAIENALYYLCTNAPVCHADAYSAIAENMTTYVLQNSRSWDGRQGSRVLPQSWNGYAITYWTPNRFDVTFDANGGQFDAMGGSTWSEQQITDTPYALPSTEPVRPGWAFEGWWTEQTGGAEVRYTTLVTATRTHTLYAHWRSLGEGMTVTFNSNGGTVVVPGTQGYVPGQTFGQFPVPTRRGYTFQGWWTEAVNGVLMTEATEVPAADMELFAHWSPITYLVRFHANGGTGTMSDQPFTYDVSGALKTHAFTRPGFAFTGWATIPSGQVRYAENKTVVNLEEVDGEIVDLYAVWSGVGYSVRFDSNGGTGIMDNQTIAVGETQNLWPCVFARGGYTFAGWALSPTDAEAKKVSYLDGAAVRDLATVNGAVVPLYAVWVTGSQTVRITFNANGGSVAPNDYWDCVVGTAVEAFPTPTRPGFTFVGWFTAASGGTQVTSIARVTSAQTFYAHWTENGGVVPGDDSCIVTFNANGGSVSETTRKVDAKSAVGALPTPMRMGYSFIGWFTAATGGTQVTASTVVRASVTYYAHWQYVGSADDTTIVIELQQSYEAEPDGTFPLEMSEFVGSTSTPKLSVKGLPTGLKFDAKMGVIAGKATKPGKYTVTVSATNATVKKPVTKTFELVVPNLASEVLQGLEQDTEAYGKIVCGVAFDPGLVGCAPEIGWALKASGLPTGLKLVQDEATGAYSITGVPTKAGTYTVTFTVSKGKDKQMATITLNVEALPTWAQGTFAGRVSAISSKPPYQEYGSASMTVAANGKISGKIALLGTNWTFKADSVGRVEHVERVEESSINIGTNFVINAVAKAGKTTMPVVLRVASGGEVARDARPYLVNAKAEGVVDGTWSLALWRNMWKDKATAVTAKAELTKWEGLYTLSLEDGGYLSLTIGKDGNVKASGKLSDGTKVSATSPLVYDEEYGWLAYFYTAPSGYKGGSFAIAVGFDGPHGASGGLIEAALPMGPARWTSRNPQATGAYGEGFGRTLDFFGAYYGKKPDVSAWSSAKFDVESPDGYTFDGVAPKVTVAQATGIFKGSCSFLPDGGGKAKKANFEGIVVLGAETQQGCYLWDAAGSYVDPKSNKPKTYKYKESHPVSLTR